MLRMSVGHLLRFYAAKFTDPRDRPRGHRRFLEREVRLAMEGWAVLAGERDATRRVAS